MAISVTVEDGTGLAGANSYASVADADTYFDTRPRSDAWLELTDDEKAALLIHATRILDGAVTWDGDPLNSTQALGFPRYPDDLSDAQVPAIIPIALFELAISLNATDLTAESATAGLSVIEVGPIKIETDPQRPVPTIPRFVRELLAPYGTPRGSSANVRLIRR